MHYKFKDISIMEKERIPIIYPLALPVTMCPDKEVYVNPTPGEFPMMGCGTPNEVQYFTEDVLKLFKELGMNLAQNILDYKEDCVNKREGAIFDSLKNAKAVGIKLMLRICNPKYEIPTRGALQTNEMWELTLKNAVKVVVPSYSEGRWNPELYKCWETMIERIYAPKTASNGTNDLTDYSEQIGGLMLKDEPTLTLFWILGECKNRINDVFERLNVKKRPFFYVNLFKDDFTKKNAGTNLSGNLDIVPNRILGGFEELTDYDSYVDQFTRVFNPPCLSFDAYPEDFRNNTTRNYTIDFYNSLIAMSKRAMNENLPFWSTVLTSSQSDGATIISIISLHSLRFQAYNAIAFGAQGLSFWRIGQGKETKDGVPTFPDAPISLDGKKTNTFNLVKKLTDQIKKYKHVFLGANVTYLKFSKTPPYTVKADKTIGIDESYIANNSVLANIHIDEQDVGILVSRMQNGSKWYTMIVNQNIVGYQTLKIRFMRSVLDVTNNSKQIKASPNVETIILEPGDWRIFEDNNSVISPIG